MIGLVVGLGMGNLYVQELASMCSSVDTVDVDKNKNPTYLTAAQLRCRYDIAVICTPNWTHESIAREIADKCDIVLIEKPGVENSKAWRNLVRDFPRTRFMMIKNNQYRDAIEHFKELADKSKSMQVIWSNNNRIPYPGGWFTNRKLSFGGVSRDLMPHLLSYYCVLNDHAAGVKVLSKSEQHHNLESIKSTDYGIINPNGVYDVDDFCEIRFKNNNKDWSLIADWDNKTNSELFIQFDNTRFDLGLCPETAYKKMIETAVQNLNNDSFWLEQLNQDIWIQKQLEAL